MDKDLFSKFEPFVREGLNDEELAQLQALRESFDAGISEYESLSTQLSDERKARRDLLFKGRTSFEKEEKEVIIYMPKYMPNLPRAPLASGTRQAGCWRQPLTGSAGV